MKFNEAIGNILEGRKYKKTVLAKGEAKNRMNTVYTLMKRNNPTLDTMVEWCDKLGYEVVLKPKQGMGEGMESYVMEGSGEE